VTAQQQRERARFKGKARQLQLVDALFENSRALAKVISAAEYLDGAEYDRWPLYAALADLLHHRRAMRTELEKLNAAERMEKHGNPAAPDMSSVQQSEITA
jgi:hypothetical protein